MTELKRSVWYLLHARGQSTLYGERIDDVWNFPGFNLRKRKSIMSKVIFVLWTSSRSPLHAVLNAPS